MRHQEEAERNLRFWERKPLLREIYRDFHRTIAAQVAPGLRGEIIEIGSGIGNLRDVVPGCVRTDSYPSPHIDRVENAYALTCGDATVSHLILFDVFHHLKYPGTALREFRRVLVPRGRLILFDPYVSALGLLVWGLAHPEPMLLFRPIQWEAPDGWSATGDEYYAAAGNATRLFGLRRHRTQLQGWSVLLKRRMSAISYVASGGYSGPQLYPARWLPSMRTLDRLLDRFPLLFGTRLLVVLEKAGPS
ncbi:MAG TPA: methyltransferase domain-containing protein [Candidatus Cryosericum sp.]|nr:methyltransferase domain-containing protein [Candidatus Cryosericum sp.]